MSTRTEATKTTEVKGSGLLAIGTRVNQFEIRSILGEGGTAVVYEAVHTKLNAAVALKIINMRGPHAPNAAARLRREAELCAAVEDPHVPKVYDVGALPDGTPYLVMEKVVGPTLESLLMRGRLGLRLGTLVLRDLLRAVEAVQRAGVVHRDIKPANIIVQFSSDRTPSVRLMDFGVSRSLFFRKGTSAALTRRGTILGTPEYMAPEQIQDQSIDVRTDVYALGVVGYELFAGRVHFEGEQPAEVVTAVLRREHKPLSMHRPEVPRELEDLITRAMEAAPTRRFAHAKAMREELEARLPRALWLSASSTQSVAAPLPAMMVAGKRKHGALRIILSTSLAVTLGVGVTAVTLPRCESNRVRPDPIATKVEPAATEATHTAPQAAALPIASASPIAATSLAALEPSPEAAPRERATRPTNASPRAPLRRAKAKFATRRAESLAELPEPMRPAVLAPGATLREQPGELTEVVLRSPSDAEPLPVPTSSARPTARKADKHGATRERADGATVVKPTLPANR